MYLDLQDIVEGLIRPTLNEVTLISHKAEEEIACFAELPLDYVREILTRRPTNLHRDA